MKTIDVTKRRSKNQRENKQSRNSHNLWALLGNLRRNSCSPIFIRDGFKTGWIGPVHVLIVPAVSRVKTPSGVLNHHSGGRSRVLVAAASMTSAPGSVRVKSKQKHLSKMPADQVNVNDLLNFTLPPRQQRPMASIPRRSRKTGTSQGVWNKERKYFNIVALSVFVTGDTIQAL
jgi:hypothetical protein